MRTKVKGFTLLELIIALILFSIIILAFTNFELFGRFQLISSDRRAKLQNETSRLIDHISKHIIEAAQRPANYSFAGDPGFMGPGQVVSITSPGDGLLLTYLADVVVAPATLADGVGDTWRAYRFYNNTASADNRNQVQYCSQCNDSGCATCTGGWATVSYHIATFTPTPNPLTNNSVNINTNACWDPLTAILPNGDQDNPCVSMQATITLPSVAIN